MTTAPHFFPILLLILANPDLSRSIKLVQVCTPRPILERCHCAEEPSPKPVQRYRLQSDQRGGQSDHPSEPHPRLFTLPPSHPDNLRSLGSVGAESRWSGCGGSRGSLASFLSSRLGGLPRQVARGGLANRSRDDQPRAVLQQRLRHQGEYSLVFSLQSILRSFQYRSAKAPVHAVNQHFYPVILQWVQNAMVGVLLLFHRSRRP